MRSLLLPLLLCAAPSSAQEEAPKQILVAPPTEVREAARKPAEEAAPEEAGELPRPSMLVEEKKEESVEDVKREDPQKSYSQPIHLPI